MWPAPARKGLSLSAVPEQVNRADRSDFETKRRNQKSCLARLAEQFFVKGDCRVQRLGSGVRRAMTCKIRITILSKTIRHPRRQIVHVAVGYDLFQESAR